MSTLSWPHTFTLNCGLSLLQLHIHKPKPYIYILNSWICQHMKKKKHKTIIFFFWEKNVIVIYMVQHLLTLLKMWETARPISPQAIDFQAFSLLSPPPLCCSKSLCIEVMWLNRGWEGDDNVQQSLCICYLFSRLLNWKPNANINKLNKSKFGGRGEKKNKKRKRESTQHNKIITQRTIRKEIITNSC